VTDFLTNSRVILYYNGAISALTLFLQHPNASVCSPSPLPVLSSILEQAEQSQAIVHSPPTHIVRAISQSLDLPEDLLQADDDFRVLVDTPDGIITVYLAHFKVLDPPHALMASKNCKFKTLTELRNRPPTEMELLRLAYVQIMES
jgi:hypothetical protein